MGIEFLDEYNCIMLISGMNLRTLDGQEIERIVGQTLKGKTNGFFFGNLFGRFDLVVEFTEKSAKIAMNLAGNIQGEVIKALPGRKICSTLVLGTMILSRSSEMVYSKDYNEAVRVYVFVRTRKGNLAELEGVVREINSIKPLRAKIRLMWTDSLYQLLVVSGPCLDVVLNKTREFREKADGLYEETSSYVSLRYNDQDGKDPQDDHTHRAKCALIFVKLKKIGKLKLGDRDLIELSAGYGFQPRRLGGYDKILAIRKDTLFDIMNTVNTIREQNDDLVFHTSTLLFYPEKIV